MLMANRMLSIIRDGCKFSTTDIEKRMNYSNDGGDSQSAQRRSDSPVFGSLAVLLIWQLRQLWKA
jgi:hypothetical protein